MARNGKHLSPSRLRRAEERKPKQEEYRLAHMPEQPQSTASRSTEESEKSIWHHITDHPKIAAVLAMLALAATFSPRASAPAAWACIAFAWILAVAFTGGEPHVKRSRHPVIYTVATALLVGVVLAVYGHWLTGYKDQANSIVSSSTAPIHTPPTTTTVSLIKQLSALGLRIGVMNDGGGTATAVKVNFTAKILRLPSKEQVGMTYSGVIGPYTLSPKDTGDASRSVPFDLPGFSNDTWKSILDTKETVWIEGSLSYNNGVENLPGAPFCYGFIAYDVKTAPGSSNGTWNFQPCEGFDAELQNVYRIRREVSQATVPPLPPVIDQARKTAHEIDVIAEDLDINLRKLGERHKEDVANVDRRTGISEEEKKELVSVRDEDYQLRSDILRRQEFDRYRQCCLRQALAERTEMNSEVPGVSPPDVELSYTAPNNAIVLRDVSKDLRKLSDAYAEHLRQNPSEIPPPAMVRNSGTIGSLTVENSTVNGAVLDNRKTGKTGSVSVKNSEINGRKTK